MARFGRALTTRPIIKGFPPGTSPGPADPTAPVAGGLSVTGGGRHGRGTPSRPLVLVSPRPIPSSSTVYTDSGVVYVRLFPTGSDLNTHSHSATAEVRIVLSGEDSYAITGGSGDLLLIHVGS